MRSEIALPANHKKTSWPWQSTRLVELDPDLSCPGPKISIITPSFNQGHFIEETIRSVLFQSYPNLEYIIIDGGSTDNTIEVIKRYEYWLTYWVSEQDRGQSHAINKGLERSTGDIVAWLNADDIYLPDSLSYVAKAFVQNKAEWSVGITLIVDTNLKELDRFIPQVNTGNWRAKGYKTYGWLDFVLTHRSGTALPQPSSFWSREAILKAGGIDESFRYAMDQDLYGRLAHEGYRPRLIPQSLACFRNHQEQKTSRFPFVFWEEELRSARKWRQKNIAPEEKQALVDYETWFVRRIRWERLTTITGTRRLFELVKDNTLKLKGIPGKIKSILHKEKNESPLKGVVPKEIIAQYLPDNPVIIEAGAHIGLDTEELARYFPSGKIYAFEPVPSLFLQLSERTRPYGNVYCFPLALSDQSGEAVMYISSGASDGSSSLLPPKDHLIDHPDVAFEEAIQVPCITLDAWAASHKIEKIDLLWLDLQGNELNTLKSGLKVLEGVKAIYTEVNLKEVYEGAPVYSELREWLETHNFRVEVEEIPWEDGGNVLFVRTPSL